MEIKSPALPQLGPEARAILLRVAREAIAAALRGEYYQPPPGSPAPLDREGAAFVSLHIDGDLRGCIGVVRETEALVRTVANCARAAALEDPRFLPLALEELSHTEIEISVLGPRRPLPQGELPRPGFDGVIVSRGGIQGLLLPQVAREQGWDGRTFLEETCRKAGLERDAWQRGARVQLFEALVFSDREGAT